ncbi:response regulator [Bdellovibrionota bacterium FG-1]
MVDFASQARVLIADPSVGSRTRLMSMLKELGFLETNIISSGDYHEALACIQKQQPQILLCEFKLGVYSGLDLIQEQRKINPDSRKSVFALITGNTSQSAVAAAAEEDVDTFIIKPYSSATLKRSLTLAIQAKLFPSDYSQMIDQAKTMIARQDYDAAIVHLNEAMKVFAKPALACFYKGQAEALKKAVKSATEDYQLGLEFNKIHYKCLNGLFELHYKNQDYPEAYDVAKKLVQYFPANPTRLASVLRLAIMTQNYDDIEGYYRVFQLIGGRHDELVRSICSALIVTGKYFLLSCHGSRGLVALEKAAKTAAERTKFLRYVIEVLVDFELYDDAQRTLGRFPLESQQGYDYLTSQALIKAEFALG